MAYTLPEPPQTLAQGVMGIDLGVQVPAVGPVIGTGTRFFGNGRAQRACAAGVRSGRAQRAKRRQFYARRQQLQRAKQVRAVRKSHGKAQRWMRDVHHKRSRQIVCHAQARSVGVIRLARLAGIRQRTARPRGGAKARNNNRLIATWTFHQLATRIASTVHRLHSSSPPQFIASTAGRVGLAVEGGDPAYTSQTCPACSARHTATDRRDACTACGGTACGGTACGGTGHRDAVGAINQSRRAGRCGESSGATVA